MIEFILLDDFFEVRKTYRLCKLGENGGREELIMLYAYAILFTNVYSSNGGR
jgi:hypothetical protein